MAEPETSTSRSRSGLGLKTLAGLAVAVGLLVVVHAYRQNAAQRDLAAALAETDALEPDGWRLEDLNRQRRVIPDEENSALIALQALAKKPSSWPAWEFDTTDVMYGYDTNIRDASYDWLASELPPNRSIPEQEFNVLRNEVCRAYRMYDLVSQMEGKQAGRYPIKWNVPAVATEFDELQKLRLLTQALRYQAIVKAQEGSGREAWLACRRQFDVIRSIGDEPGAVPNLIRISSNLWFLITVQRVLAFVEIDEAMLHELQVLLELEEKEPLLTRVLRGERAILDRTYEELERGATNRITLARIMSAKSRLLPLELEAYLSPYYLDFREANRARSLRLFNAHLKHTHLSEEQLTRMIADNIQPTGLFLVASHEVAWLEKMALVYLRHLARLRCGRVMLAAERYRLKYGSWPETLEALTPEFIEAVPLDPYDGQPLRWVHFAEGRKIYSVGQDRKDDGGDLDGVIRTQSPQDYGYRLYDPEHRHKPPPATGKDQ